jgi:predicted ATPase
LEFAEAIERIGSPASVCVPVRVKRPPAPLVGREPEIQKLEDSLVRALKGSGAVVLLTGEAGIGKTALAESFADSIRRGHPEVVIGQGSCVEQYGIREPYLPFLEAVGRLLTGVRRERVMALLRQYAPTWCLQFPAVFSDSAFKQVQQDTIGATKERMFRELGDALDQMTAAFPVAFVLEDLQWADSSSIDLLRHLGRRSTTSRLLLVGTARPEESERGSRLLENCKRELQTQSACQEIALSALTQHHIARYMQDRLTPNTFPPELAGIVHRKTGGHPLFVTGVFQLLSERGDVVCSDGAWRLERPIEELNLDVPDSVRSMIAKKIEGLDSEDRRTLQYASIEGEEFRSTVLASLLDSDELTVEERLERLGRVHHLIQMIGEEEQPDGSLATRYRFAHALYQNAVNSELLTQRRTLLHRRAGETLVRCYGSETPRIAAALATHFERGRDYARAIDYFLQAGENATTLYAPAQAIEYYSHALELIAKVPRELRFSRQMILHSKRSDAYLSLRQLPQAAADCEAMISLARIASDAEWQCRALNALGLIHNYGRQPDDMGACATQALAVAETIGNGALRSEALSLLANSRMVIGNLEEAHVIFGDAISESRSLRHAPALLQGLTYRGVAHFFQTQYAEAEALEMEASELAAESRDGFYLALSLFYLGLTRANRGRISGALNALNQALELATRNGNQIALSRVPNGIGWVYREIGDVARAIEYNQACVETARRTGAVEAEANALINLISDYIVAAEPAKALEAMSSVEPLFDRERWNRWRFFEIRHQAASAEYWLNQQKLDQAEEHARQLLTNARRYGIPQYVAIAHRVLGEVAAIAGDADAAEHAFTDSAGALANNPAPLVEWRSYAALGRLLTRSGRRAAGHEAYTRAARVLREISDNISDSGMRSSFLNNASVQQVLAGAA